MSVCGDSIIRNKLNWHFKVDFFLSVADAIRKEVKREKDKERKREREKARKRERVAKPIERVAGERFQVCIA